MTNTEKYQRARMFAVGPDTDPSGTAFFAAHIRLEGRKPPAPRLHYYDDTDTTGRIYIGYIGEHLPTGGTS